MSRKSPPKYVISVLERLERNGFEAYMVGGCVRDAVMGRRPNDWDITTSALPDELIALFPHSHPTGLAHGTVTVIMRGSPLEVTTFRSDGEYKDHRRPDSVRFISDLNADLERRDFTINALAMPISGELRDPFGGLADIDAKLIRCVGDPELRFEEDALRMLRAFRFSAVLGFDIESKTLKAIKSKAYLSKNLAMERIRVELEKTLLSSSPQIISDIIEYGLLSAASVSSCAVSELTKLNQLPKNRTLRWSGLCALLQKNGVITDAKSFLTALRNDKVIVRSCSSGCELALSGAPSDNVSWKRLLAASGIETARCTAAACDVLYGSEHTKLLSKVLQSGDCFSLSQLAVSGSDLASLGYNGTRLGAALSSLLDHVIIHPSDNQKDTLLCLAREIKS